jgi:hypothetical protein
MIITDKNLYGLWGDSTAAYAVGQSGTILAHDLTGSAWLPESSGTTVDLRAVWGQDGGPFVAVGAAGTILMR